MDRRAALHPARRDRHRPEGEVATRGRGRCSKHEPQYYDRQGAGRCADCPLPEWRAHRAVERLSDAAPAARLRGQHERQMAAPDQARRGTGDGDQRNHAVHVSGGGPQGLAVLLPDGSKVLRYPPLAGADAERAGLLRDFRPCLFGNGRVAKVMVSADGGKSWGEAALDAPVLSKSLTRFRMPWRWDGQPVVLRSRAWDEAGNIQPTRNEMFAERGAPKVNVPVTAFPMGHMNVITSWAIDAKGEIKHVYA